MDNPQSGTDDVESANARMLLVPQLDDEHMTTQAAYLNLPVRQQRGYVSAKSMPVVTVSIGREIKNNPNMYHHASELSGTIEKMVHLRSKKNSVYGVYDLNAGMIRAAMLNASVGSCANSMRATSDEDDTDCNVDKVGNSDYYNNNKKGHAGMDFAVPCDRWFADALSRVDVDDTIHHFTKCAVSHLKRITRRRNIPKDGLTVAIDAHLIPRYDRKPGPELTRSRQKSGTTYFERYMSVQCVDDGMRLVLAFVPLKALDKMYEAAEKLFDILQENKIHIRLALFDRGFFSSGMLDLLNRRGIPYLMPCANTQGVVCSLNEFSEFCRMGVSINILNGSGRRVPYILIITKRKSAKKSSTEPKDKFIGFATNIPDTDIAEYGKRWVIETGYSMIEAIRVWTRSTKICARVFCFAFTLLLYNIWVMLNALLGLNTKLATRFGITLITIRILLLRMTLYAPKKPPQSLKTLHMSIVGEAAQS